MFCGQWCQNGLFKKWSKIAQKFTNDSTKIRESNKFFLQIW